MEFVHADKHGAVLQVDTINFGGHDLAQSTYYNNKFCNILRET